MWDIQAYEESLRALAWPELTAWEGWMHYALAGGGKRLRPWLAWEAYAFYAQDKASWPHALPVLQAIELLHTFTLVHDDVMDKSALRRGRPTVYRQTDENTAILIGDALLIAVYQQLAAVPAPHNARLIQLLSQAALRVCHGQLLDLALAAKPTAEVSLDDYLRMITEKTGALIGASLEMGAALADVPPPELAALRAAGEAIGRFFQLQDDYLDAFGQETGKVPGGDIAEGKKTFLWLWAWQEAAPTEKRLLDDPNTPPEQRREVGLHLYMRLGLKSRAEAFLAEAFKELHEKIAAVRMAPVLKELTEKLLGRQR
ncbi:MAG: hypothetical protein KatS3mg025_1746 [Bacteroidia bacterium]|nr:MAG: hypothetical protein KatS3mg025_1746 [Bacteroidia bacterium]